MKTELSISAPAEVETECLVVVALDHGEKDKPEVGIETSDAGVKQAVEGVMSTGELTGKIFETTFLYKPAKLRAKRLLVVGGGKARSFSSYELRRVAGAATRALKPKSIR